MYELLSNSQTTFHCKLAALIQLSMLEQTAKRPDLQATHAEAIDTFVESQGGMSALLSQEAADDPVQLNCRLYAGQFVRAGSRGPTPKQFTTAKTSFLLALGRLQAWASRIPFRTTLNQFITSDGIRHQRQSLNALTRYLHKVVEDWLLAADSINSWQQHAGAFFCPLSLAMTIVECDLTPTSAFDILHRVQECMKASVTSTNQPGRELDNLHPVAAAYIFGDVRSDMFPNDADAREVRIATVMVNAHKICTLLPNARRIDIATSLVEYVLSVGCSSVSVIEKAGALFGQERLKKLDQEIDDAWDTAVRQKR